MNRATRGRADTLKTKFAFNTNSQTANNNVNNNSNNVGQNNSNNDKEGEQENEHIIECMNILNEQEEAEQFAFSLLEEIIWNAETLLFEKYIEKQIIPFTLDFFENKIMEIIDWNFFKYDNGIINEDEWCPDIELEPIINDSWARGAIPVKYIPKKNITVNNQLNLKSQTSIASINEIKKHLSKKNISNKTKTKKLKEDIENNTIQTNNKTLSTKKDKTTKVFEKKPTKKIKNITNSSLQNNKFNKPSIKEKQKSYIYKLKNKSEIIDIINNKQSTIQLQNTNKVGYCVDNIYNYNGNLISSIKYSPDKSFEQNVKAKLVEPIKPKSKLTDRKALSAHMHEKKEAELETINLANLYKNDLSDDIEQLQNDIKNLNNFIRQKQSLSPEVKKTLRNKNSANTQRLHSSKIKRDGKNDKLDPLLNYSKKDISYNYEKYVEDSSLEIPSFMNSISIAPGVKLCEGNTYKAGPSLYPNNIEENNDPTVLLRKKGKPTIPNNREPQLNNELLKEIILRTNPSLKSE
jgi:hypothetical protein